MSAPEAFSPAADAVMAAVLFAIDPVALGGVNLRARPGAARDHWVALMRGLCPAGVPVRRIPLQIDDTRLLGGLDMAASLAAGRPVLQPGVLAQGDGGLLLVAMAERLEPATAARLATVLDRGEVTIERDGLAARLPARVGLIAFDEGLEPEERPPEALLERLAFHLSLDGLNAGEFESLAPQAAVVAGARRRLADVRPARADLIEALCVVSDRLGLPSLRGPILAMRAARAHAALGGRTEILAEDAAMAARLVFGLRAATPPDETAAAGDSPASAEPTPPDQEHTDQTDSPGSDAGAEVIVAAIQAMLPDDLLTRIERRASRSTQARSQGGGGGEIARSAKRGRPAGVRLGPLRSGDRLHLTETLRAAAPWQSFRGGGSMPGPIRVRPEDLRIRKFVQSRAGTTIFVVDASGSSAVQRLADAKGAVELLLAKAYVTRARVAMVAFRGRQAERLLPPTRSLTRAKRLLADLAGGGGTPLAAGIDCAYLLAREEKAKDRTPTIVLLTDGRANIGLDGAPGRAAAEADALASARRVREAGIGAAFVDTSVRPGAGADRYAKALGGVYAHLPYIDAKAVAGLIDDLSSARR